MNVLQYFPNISQEEAHFASLAILFFGLFRYKKHPDVSEYYQIVKAAYESDGSDYPELYQRLVSIKRNKTLAEKIADIMDLDRDQREVLKEVSLYMFLALPIEKQKDVINTCVFRVK